MDKLKLKHVQYVVKPGGGGGGGTSKVNDVYKILSLNLEVQNVNE